MKLFCKYFFTGIFLLCVRPAHAQSRDTLADVKLFSNKPLNVAASATPVQQLDKPALSGLGAVSVAEAVKNFAGVAVKDYGGIGGLKTVSIRSLGANHTGVMYDGIMLGDAQGGQIDLGKFSLDNIEQVRLFNNQPPAVLLPARTFASAGVIALSTSSEQNNNKNGDGLLSARFKYGSFGFINPSVFINAQAGKYFQSLSGEYQAAKGAYPFVSYENETFKKKRTNSDIKTYRVEYDATYKFNDSNRIKFKAYYYNSKRGLPGAVVLYNDFPAQRLNNENFFSQISWQRTISRKGALLISGKYSADYKYYLDPSYQNNYGKLENKFHQQEIYSSAVFSYKILPSLSAAYAVDYFRSKLKRSDIFAALFANPARNNFLNNIVVKWRTGGFELNGNLLYTALTETVKHGNAANDLYKLTPAVAASFKPFDYFPFLLRASYKSIFRAPTFDDLYYTNIGNTTLRPEYARQYNFGISIDKPFLKLFRRIVFTSDVYYNNITDQILAVPRQNLFQWTTLNIGKVHTIGIDNVLHLELFPYKKLTVAAALAYTLQRAENVSDPASPLYKTQLAYTPQHSGSLNLKFMYGRFDLSYNALASSARYRLGALIPENRVQGWLTHDIAASYALSTKKNFDYRFIAEANNISNLQYEIIKYYPMPRFNYRFGIIVNFKLLTTNKST